MLRARCALATQDMKAVDHEGRGTAFAALTVGSRRFMNPRDVSGHKIPNRLESTELLMQGNCVVHGRTRTTMFSGPASP
jgi:hypothetical protein